MTQGAIYAHAAIATDATAAKLPSYQRSLTRRRDNERHQAQSGNRYFGVSRRPADVHARRRTRHPRGDAVVPVINRLLTRFDHAFATQDWHPPAHSSFASVHPGHKPDDTVRMPYGEQVLWPDHAIQGSANAGLHPEVDLTKVEVIIRKGFRRTIDSYSTFFENDRRTPTGLDGWLRQRGFPSHLPRRFGYRFLRGLVGRGRGAARLRRGCDRGCLSGYWPTDRGRLHDNGRRAHTSCRPWRPTCHECRFPMNPRWADGH